jgi:hypothetical protein
MVCSTMSWMLGTPWPPCCHNLTDSRTAVIVVGPSNAPSATPFAPKGKRGRMLSVDCWCAA